MTAPRMAGESLTDAFRRFERAALTLEQRHDALCGEVDRLERSLLDAHRKLEAVLDALDTGVAVLASDGTLERTNQAFDRLSLLDARGRIGSPELCELVAGDAAQGGAARFRRPGIAGDRHLSAVVAPVGDRRNTRVLTVSDVTEIRREEEEDSRRRRLQALGTLAAELAHEVRNPLGSIRLFAAMLTEDLASRPEQQEMAERILAATAGLEATVSNLLAFASPGGGSRRPVDLASVARDVCALLAPACSLRGIRLDAPPGGREANVDGDPEGLRQVLLNLIGNALAATDREGRIRVDARERSESVRLTVEDDGRGIRTEDLPRVIDPFFTRTEGGTGLGLSIVHRIVEAHHGKLAIDSREGRGTRVRVDIPRSRRQGRNTDG